MQQCSQGGPSPKDLPQARELVQGCMPTSARAVSQITGVACSQHQAHATARPLWKLIGSQSQHGGSSWQPYFIITATTSIEASISEALQAM